ncbi:MAG TPA: MBOAT family O-acyltransferase [Vicinamibacterales bacterium]|nr:MBOAT family O-acyltransferase [Vicinamibacterales bacterium]
MIFHSLAFIAFFVVTLAIYWRLQLRAQNVLLFVASYVFYGWVHPWWPILLFVTTFVDYWAARKIDERRPDPRSGISDPRRKAWLYASIVANLGLLGVYKYFDFFVENVSAAAAAIGWQMSPIMLRLALPAGISFYTFQSMSYTIDVYRGHAPARTRFLDVAAFVSFFPHLVAGPIMRATNLLPQIEQPRRFDAAAARDASVLIVWGFFKKLIIADNVGVIANKVFALQQPDFYVLWAGVFAFAIQIYADFSAYTDIARGVAKWYGFDLIKNFERPYLASGPADFWRRWNISLSTWFRDYVYIPLGGSRRGPGRVAFNLMITFLASGIWHGASWNYVLWGAYHGLLLVVARAFAQIPGLKTQAPRPRTLRLLQVPAMFILTCVGWLIFRETELSQLVADLRLSPAASSPDERAAGLYLFLLVFLYSLPLWIHDLWAELRGPDLVEAIETPEREVRWERVAAQAALCGVLFAIILVMRSQSTLNFIYFAF